MPAPSLGRQRPERLLPARPLPCRGNNATLACGRAKTTRRRDQLRPPSASKAQWRQLPDPQLRHTCARAQPACEETPGGPCITHEQEWTLSTEAAELGAARSGCGAEPPRSTVSAKHGRPTPLGSAGARFLQVGKPLKKTFLMRGSS